MENYEPELVSSRAVAKILGISERTIEDWVYEQRRRFTPDPLPYHKIGRLTRFSLADVRAWYRRRRVSLEVECADGKS